MKTVKSLVLSLMIVVLALNCLACDMQAKVYEASDLKYFTFSEVEGGYAVSAKAVGSLPETLAIPEEYEGKAVVAISDGAFEGANIQKLIVPKSVLKIGKRAFANCSMSSIYFFSGVTQIDVAAFYGCASLQRLNLPASLTAIGDSAFNSCTLINTLKLPEKLLTVGTSAFANCLSLESVYIPRRVQSIGNYAFSNCAEGIEFEISAGNEYYKLDQNGLPVAR